MNQEEAKLRQYLEKVTVDLRKARRRVRDLEQEAHEPIAIVGIGCRYPGGVESAEQLWDLVAAGRDAIAPFPDDREWELEGLYHPDPAHPGTANVREGGFVDGFADFDASFFGIGPNEALAIDPQQRLALEVGWEAFESAGVDPRSLRRTETGVFVGGAFGDYSALLSAAPPAMPVSVIAGAAACLISGRIAYSFGLEGPTMSLDTACSSSLVALHLAVQALRTGECTMALGGGVSVMCTPAVFVESSNHGTLAADGRCKSFADAADGTSLAEGVGMLALERLSDAQQNGRRILATIRGSAVNQDGASNGLAAPNGPSQERVIRRALANARLRPQDVDAVEAHGTGTALGDPIEAGALLATYGQDREQPLRLGSIKSNIGHTAAAAGVAGVIKMVMAMREGVLPKTLHVDAPSTNIRWESGRVELLTEPVEWEVSGPRRAGVSSFGVSGTNAHLILEQAPVGSAEGGPTDTRRPILSEQVLLPLSAKSEPALRESAARLASRLRADSALDPTDVGFSLATTKPTFEHRAVAVGADRDGLLAALSTLAAGNEGSGALRGRARGERRPVFVFPGQGSHWQGMALELLASSPAFAAHMQKCEEAFAPHLDWSLEDVLVGATDAPSIKRVEIVLPTMFAVMVSLAELWRDCGIRPGAVIGHSQGEVVAAHVAGGLSLEDAAMLVAVRSQLISTLSGTSGMVAVAAPAEQVEPALERWEGRIEISAFNGPASTVLSGDRESIDQLLAHCEEVGLRARRIPGAIAGGHSVYVEVLREQVLESLASLSPRSGDVPFHSTAMGKVLDTAELDAEYWYRSMRLPVRFEQGIRGLLAEGHRALIEVSPHPIFALPIREVIEDELGGTEDAAVIPTLRRDEGGAGRFALSLAGAHLAGATPDWEALFGGTGAQTVPLPTYPFQRKHYWFSAHPAASDPAAIGQAPAEHPLLGASIESARGEGRILTGRISLQTQPWLADHAIVGASSLPGAAFVELALRAGGEVDAGCIEELTLEAPLVLPRRGGVQIQVAVAEPGGEGEREIAIHSRPEDAEGEGWTCHAKGVLSAHAAAPPAPGFESWPPAGAEEIELGGLHDRLADAGLECGPAFQNARAAWRLGEELFVEVSLSPEQAGEAEGFAMHPALLEAALHVAHDPALAVGDEGEREAIALPAAWRGVRLGSRGASSLRVRVVAGEEGLGIVAVDQAGAAAVSIDSVLSRPIDPDQARVARQRRSIYRIGWQEPRSPSPSDGDRRSLATLGEDPAHGLAGVASYPDLTALKAAIQAGAEAPKAVLVSALSVEEISPPEAVEALSGWALALIGAWLEEGALSRSRLVFLTRGAAVAGGGEDPDLAAAALSGLLRSVRSEHGDRFCSIDRDAPDGPPELMASALALAGDEPQIAIREGRLLVPRLEVAADTGEAASPIDPTRTALIVAATGDSGAMLARHLVSAHGVRYLLLVSGGLEPPDETKLVAEAAELGAEVTVADCDIADRAQLQKLIGSIPSDRPLGAVVDAAGRLGVDGAWHLHELTRDLDLSQFLTFSSTASLIGETVAADDAATGAFLDALAHRRHAQGLSAISLAWGDFTQFSGEDLDRFDAARAVGGPALVATALDRAQLRTLADAGELPAILSGLVRTQARYGQSGRSMQARLAAVGEEERRTLVLELVRADLAAILGYGSAEEIDPDRMLQELGLDSLGAVELRNRIAASTGLTVPFLALADQPTATGVTRYVAAHLNDSAAASNTTEKTLVGLLGKALEDDSADDFMALLREASRFRPTFDRDSPHLAGESVRAVRLSPPTTAPSLILISSVGPISGPGEYVRLAREFQDQCGVFALPLPGFRPNESLPVDLPAATALYAELIAAADLGSEFVLGGHSSGGWMAHALASHLEDLGVGPTAIVLLDSFLPEPEMVDLLAPLALANDYAASGGSELDDRRLTATGAYMRLFADWQPESIEAPTVMVRAEQPIPGLDLDGRVDWRAQWPLPHSLIEVPGDHLTIMSEHAGSTSQAVRNSFPQNINITVR